MSARLSAAVAMGFLVAACASSGGETRGSPEMGAQPSSDPTKAFACNWTRELARACYDEATSTVPCEQVPRQVMVQPAESKPPPPDVQSNFDDVCINACRAAQHGIQWEQVLAVLQCIQ
jgi:hypothetical protein